jgi:predicted secreted protein
MAVNKGTDVLVKLASTVVGCTTNASIEFMTDIVDITTKDSTGANKEKLAGEHDAKLSIEGKWDETTSLYSMESLSDAERAGTAVTWIYGRTTPGAVTFTGSAIIAGLTHTAPENGACTWTANLEVTGAVTRGTAS